MLPEHTEGVGVPPLVHGSGWALFALRAALSLFSVISLRRFESLYPGQTH
jgi:hypothetical protein